MGWRIFGLAVTAIAGMAAAMMQIEPTAAVSNLSKWWALASPPPAWVIAPTTDVWITSIAAAVAMAGISMLSWPSIQRKRRALRTMDRVDGWSVSASVRTLGALPSENTLFFQKCRFVNVSATQPRILDIVVQLKIGDFQTTLSTENQAKTEYRLALDRLEKDRPARLNRMIGYISIPIHLPPAGIVEGQLEFSMGKKLIEIFSDFDRWAGKIEANIKMLEHRSGRTANFRLGFRYDAILGREARYESTTEYVIWKMRVWRNSIKRRIKRLYEKRQKL